MAPADFPISCPATSSFSLPALLDLQSPQRASLPHLWTPSLVLPLSGIFTSPPLHLAHSHSSIRSQLRCHFFRRLYLLPNYIQPLFNHSHGTCISSFLASISQNVMSTFPCFLHEDDLSLLLLYYYHPAHNYCTVHTKYLLTVILARCFLESQLCSLQVR